MSFSCHSLFDCNYYQFRILPDPLPSGNTDIKRFAPPPFPLRKFKEKSEEVDNKKKVPSPPTPVKGKNGKAGSKVVKKEVGKEEDGYKKTRLSLATMENGYIECPGTDTSRSFPKRPYSRVRDSLAIFTLIFLLLLNNIEVQK